MKDHPLGLGIRSPRLQPRSIRQSLVNGVERLFSVKKLDNDMSFQDGFEGLFKSCPGLNENDEFSLKVMRDLYLTQIDRGYVCSIEGYVKPTQPISSENPKK